MKASRMVFNAGGQQFSILALGQEIEIADSETFFTEHMIASIPELVAVELEHGEFDADLGEFTSEVKA